MSEEIVMPTVYGPRTRGKKKVMVVPAEFIRATGAFNDGPLVIGEEKLGPLLSFLLSGEHTEFIDRDHAETDPDWLQVIPYTVVWKGRTVFTYRRSDAGAEGRLHGLRSVGVGGHIDEGEDGRRESYDEAFWRELDEEFKVVSHSRSQLSSSVVGLLYDPSNDVGRVHLGVVHYLRLPNDVRFELNDPALAGGEFRQAYELGQSARDEPASWETWSRIVLSRLM